MSEDIKYITIDDIEVTGSAYGHITMKPIQPMILPVQESGGGFKIVNEELRLDVYETDIEELHYNVVKEIVSLAYTFSTATTATPGPSSTSPGPPRTGRGRCDTPR